MLTDKDIEAIRARLALARLHRKTVNRARYERRMRRIHQNWRCAHGRA